METDKYFSNPIPASTVSTAIPRLGSIVLKVASNEKLLNK